MAKTLEKILLPYPKLLCSWLSNSEELPLKKEIHELFNILQSGTISEASNSCSEIIELEEDFEFFPDRAMLTVVFDEVRALKEALEEPNNNMNRTEVCLDQGYGLCEISTNFKAKTPADFKDSKYILEILKHKINALDQRETVKKKARLNSNSDMQSSKSSLSLVIQTSNFESTSKNNDVAPLKSPIIGKDVKEYVDEVNWDHDYTRRDELMQRDDIPSSSTQAAEEIFPLSPPSNSWSEPLIPSSSPTKGLPNTKSMESGKVVSKKTQAFTAKIKEPQLKAAETEVPSNEAQENSNFETQTIKQPLFYTVCGKSGFSFIQTQTGHAVMFKCFRSCRYISLSKISFLKHLNSMHAAEKWCGWCNSCEEICDGEPIRQSLEHELKHLIDCHLNPQLKAKNMTIATPSNSAVITASNCSPTNKMTTSLHPWMERENIKHSTAAALMNHESCFVATFKCMERRCCFFTSDLKLFKEHLKRHRTEGPSAQGQHECAYCNFNGTKYVEIVDHLDMVHKHDIFGCGYCFYRSASSTNVQTHLQKYHDGKELVIFECKPGEKLGASEMKEVKKNVGEMVDPIKCAFCSKSFYLINRYLKHMKTHSNDGKTTECPKCEKLIEDELMLDHYEVCYQFGRYHCLLCRFGCKTKDYMTLHLANEHPSKLPVYCIRQGDDKAPNEPSSMTIKYLTHTQIDLTIKRRSIESTHIINRANVKIVDFKDIQM